MSKLTLPVLNGEVINPPGGAVCVLDFDLGYNQKDNDRHSKMGLFTGLLTTTSREQMYRAVHQHLKETGQTQTPFWLDMNIAIPDKTPFYINISLENALETGSVRIDKLDRKSRDILMGDFNCWIDEAFGKDAFARLEPTISDNFSRLMAEFPFLALRLFEKYPQLDFLAHPVFMWTYPAPITVLTFRKDKTVLRDAVVRSLPHIKVQF